LSGPRDVRILITVKTKGRALGRLTRKNKRERNKDKRTNEDQSKKLKD
jgi:hypothetical protein